MLTATTVDEAFQLRACVLTVAREGLDDDRAAVDDRDVAWADAVDRVRQTTDVHWPWHLDGLRQRHVTKVLLQSQCERRQEIIIIIMKIDNTSMTPGAAADQAAQ